MVDRVEGLRVSCSGSADSGFGFQGLGSTGFEGFGVTGCRGFRIWEVWGSLGFGIGRRFGCWCFGESGHRFMV